LREAFFCMFLFYLFIYFCFVSLLTFKTLKFYKFIKGDWTQFLFSCFQSFLAMYRFQFRFLVCALILNSTDYN